MSFVSVVVSNQFITVMSDGRVSGDNGIIIDERYKKFKRISPKQFIAYAGRREVCESIVNQIEYTGDQRYDLYDVTLKIKQVVTSDELRSTNALFAIGGLDIDGILRVYSISNAIDERIDPIQSKSEDGLSYKFLTSPHIVESIEKDKMEEQFIGFLQKTGFNTPNKCLKSQKLLSNFISEIDKSVNKVTYSLQIAI